MSHNLKNMLSADYVPKYGLFFLMLEKTISGNYPKFLIIVPTRREPTLQGGQRILYTSSLSTGFHVLAEENLGHGRFSGLLPQG